ncbi:MAG: amino acid permease, partial [Flavobacteriales bacterium]|nr:amino acid permease [Flavobacteriales bacterium]
MPDNSKVMGSVPVFMTAISTILGAILFLRFGYAVGNLGFLGTLVVILIGHLVTIPTALAVAEIATNQKVEGGGAYYIISRSFGLTVGAAIGITLFLSQAISVAFYVIAFAEAFEPVINWLYNEYGFVLTKKMVSLPLMGGLTLLMLTKGANVGMKTLYLVIAILFVSLLMFFMGDNPEYSGEFNWTEKVYSPDGFFDVFIIIFPAFTGIAAGLGLSGDLKNPSISIPRGTLWATVAGVIVYIAVAYKLATSASVYDLANDQMIMSKIAIWGPIIPIGLAAAAFSSALGSVIIAPRTLQALGVDRVFSSGFSRWISKGKRSNDEPVNGVYITCAIGFFFICIGDINFVAQIISMFFMVTYGAICLVSFLEHFAADPAYRPTFRSRWYISLFGALLSLWLMFEMHWIYASLAVSIMFSIYLWIQYTQPDRRGVVKLFRGVIFQLSKEMRVFLQKRDALEDEAMYWRPSVICISSVSFKRNAAFEFVSLISHKYGFGTYIHHIEGYLNEETSHKAKETLAKLRTISEGANSKVFLNTIVSPSYTSAIAQAIQLPGVSGKDNNMILFEYSDSEPEMLDVIASNYDLLSVTQFDICVLRCTERNFGSKKEIHVWSSTNDYENSNLMILLAYIILGHPAWKNAQIKLFSIYPEGDKKDAIERLSEMIGSGRLPISLSNIELIPQNKENFNEIEIKKI